jgi:hypothetical protein
MTLRHNFDISTMTLTLETRLRIQSIFTKFPVPTTSFACAFVSAR